MPSRPSEVRKAPPPARSEQNTKEKFCFPFRRKNLARANQKMRTKLFFGVASVSERRRGGASVSFGRGRQKKGCGESTPKESLRDPTG